MQSLHAVRGSSIPFLESGSGAHLRQTLAMKRHRSALLLLTGAALCFATLAADRAPSALPNVQVLAPPLTIPGLNRERTLRIYLPPSYAQSDKRYPVIYMHDAQNLFDDATSYAGEWGVDEAMNQLARSHGFEAIVVGIDHGGARRMNELSPWENPRFGKAEGEAYMAFVVDVVKKHVDTRYRTRPGPEATAIIGSSMGGLISHYAIHRYPQVFGKAGVFSPSYWFAPQVFELTRKQPLPATARVYLYAGGKEGAETVDDAQRMHTLLAEASAGRDGAVLRLLPQGEHNEAAWRSEFPRAVIWLFGLRP
jgi:predicted alpha/beta superfamily hydrolase